MESTTLEALQDKTGAGSKTPVVRHFRQALLWPLRLMRDHESGGGDRPAWKVLKELGDSTPWREVIDEYTGKSDDFHERHYNEFASFLPYVQQFLYGEGRSRTQGTGTTGDRDVGRDSPMRVFRRHDIKGVRVVAREGDAPLTLDVVHLDLYFFFDVDVVLLNLEIGASDLSLWQAQEQLYRFGRAYPAGWDADGAALHCMESVEWLGADGNVLARSDAQESETFLSHVATHRAPRTAAHWAYAIQPLVSEHSEEPGLLRYRHIEDYRMPVMAYLALDDPRRLTRSQFIRLGLVTGSGDAESLLPYGEEHLADFESNYCYDRFWADTGAAPNTRYLCNGRAFIVIGDARSHFFGCGDRGVLAQFRHQHFLLFLIAHFQKASLLMFSDQLVEALKRLDQRNMASVKRFKRAIRLSFERFLRFTHRYWFHQISHQAQVQALSNLCSRHLGLDELYEEVRVRIADMNTYLEADSLRRQASTVVRLTVVTLFGLIGTITTGFLGMNLLAEAEAPLLTKILWFAVVGGFTTWLTVYTMIKSQRLSDFIDALSDDRMSWRDKFAAFKRVWRPGAD
ncbi:hypothetical protein QTI66_12955 [Variovorax sp. J22R133]|uniref:hypothetical protein n=1 Tax=Variovorax brevis TaxID=3053503 RepID=UPI002575DEFA|nr:hypothetical protein [Variovorax sp. J22R133]MDM0113060.1 hypothetical protein [Variovorax sp. J22R133]